MTSKDPYKQGLISIIEGYKSEAYRIGADAFFQQIGKFQSIRNTLLSVYGLMVAKNLCDPIESVSDESKREFWAQAKAVSEIKEQTFMKDVAKALYAFAICYEVGEVEL